MKDNMQKKLLFSITKKDLKIQTFRSGGVRGGQHQNKRDTGIRIIHPPSGAVGESRTERSQGANKKLAFRRLVKSGKFKVWNSQMVHEIITGKTIDETVDEMMEPKNLKIEYKKDGKWR